MDVRCPECDRLYADIDFSLAGSKFGCECGHKFFLTRETEAADPVGGVEESVETSKSPDVEDGENRPAEQEPTETSEDEGSPSGTTLMDVICPECGKIFVDIDASFAGSKLGCDCGHKFFLSERAVAGSPPGGVAKTNKETASEESTEKSEKDVPKVEKPEIKVNAPKKRGIDVDIDDPDFLEEDEDFHQAPARKGQLGSMLLNQFLNLILVLLLISLCVCGYLLATGKMKSPFDIKLTPKAPEAEAGDLELEVPEE